MLAPSDKSSSPFIEAQRAPRFQFGVGTLFIAMTLFAVTSLFLMFAARLPLVTNEIQAWMGTVPSTNMDGSDRKVQLAFVLLCCSAPLVVAAALNWVSLGVNAFIRSRASKPDDDKEWEME
jgi:hypothetical protein